LISPIVIGLKWEFCDEVIDLDATIVMIDDVGNIVDAVYYNKLVSDCGSIVHSGDNEDGTGVAGFDEFITVHLNEVSFYVSYLAVLVCSFKGHGFRKVATSAVTLLQDVNKLIKVPLGKMMVDDSSVLVCFIYRQNQAWLIQNITQFGQGKNFAECEELIKKNLKNVGFDETVLRESKDW